MSRTIGFVEAAAALAVAAVSGAEAPDKVYLEETAESTAYAPLPEITEDSAAEEHTAEPIPADVPEEPEKPKRGRKKSEVSDESDSDG